MMDPPSSITVRRFSSSSCSLSSLESSSTNLFEVLLGCGCGATADPSLRSACLLRMTGYLERKQDEQVAGWTGNVQIPNHFEDAARNNHIATFHDCCYGHLKSCIHSTSMLGLLARERSVVTDPVCQPDRCISCALRVQHLRDSVLHNELQHACVYWILG